MNLFGSLFSPKKHGDGDSKPKDTTLPPQILSPQQKYYTFISKLDNVPLSDMQSWFQDDRECFIHTALILSEKVSSQNLLAFFKWDRILFLENFTKLPSEIQKQIFKKFVPEGVQENSSEDTISFFSELINFIQSSKEIIGIDFLSLLKDVLHPYIKDNLELRLALLKSCQNKYSAGLLNPKQVEQDEFLSYFLVWYLARIPSTQESLSDNYSFFVALRATKESVFKNILGNAVVYHEPTQNSLAYKLMQEPTTPKAKKLQKISEPLGLTKLEKRVSAKIVHIGDTDRTSSIPDTISRNTIPAYLLETLTPEPARAPSHSSDSSSFFNHPPRSSNSIGQADNSPQKSESHRIDRNSASLLPLNPIIDEAMPAAERAVARTLSVVFKQHFTDKNQLSRAINVEPIEATAILLRTLVEDLLDGNEWTGAQKASKLQNLRSITHVAIDYQQEYGKLFKETFQSSQLSQSKKATIDDNPLISTLSTTIVQLQRLLETETSVTSNVKTMFADAIRQLAKLAVMGQFDKQLATDLAYCCLRLPKETKTQLLDTCACVADFKAILTLRASLYETIDRRFNNDNKKEFKLSNERCDLLQIDVSNFALAYQNIAEQHPVLDQIPIIKKLEEDAQYFQTKAARIREVDYNESLVEGIKSFFGK
jgi:hypothetical protein